MNQDSQHKKKQSWEFLGSAVARKFMLPLHGAQVRFLVGELRSHKSRSSVKKRRRNNHLFLLQPSSPSLDISRQKKRAFGGSSFTWGTGIFWVYSSPPHNCDSSELTYMFQFCNKIKNSSFTYQFNCGCDVLHFYLFTYLWLCWVLVAAHRLLTAVGLLFLWSLDCRHLGFTAAAHRV